MLRRAVVPAIIILLYTFLCCPYAAAAEEAAAENLTAAASFRADSDPDFGKITDSSAATALFFTTQETITISVKKAAAALYIIWDDLPGVWMLSEGGFLRTCGQNGFLHEYIRLRGVQTEFTLEIPAGAAICEITLYSKGSLPETVQIWHPPCERADLLLFPTHGDDEHLFFGGIMPYYAGELKLRVQVAYMTNHKYTEKHRVREILDGLWTVGIRTYPVFTEFKDLYAGSLEDAERIYDSEAVAAWQVEMIRRFRPYVIVGHDFDGEYGHGAHMLNARQLARAVPAAADPAQYTDSSASYGVWDTPKLYIHLYQENRVYMDWGNLKLPAFGGRTALEMAREGYRRHASQQHWSFAVSTEGYGDCRCFGLYRSTVGADAHQNDLFENIKLEPPPAPEPTPLPQPAPSAAPITPITGSPAAKSAAESPAAAPASGTRTDAPGENGGGPGVWLMLSAAALLSGGVFYTISVLRRRRK